MLELKKIKDTNISGGKYKYVAHDGLVSIEFDTIFGEWYAYVMGECVGHAKTANKAISIVRG